MTEPTLSATPVDPRRIAAILANSDMRVAYAEVIMRGADATALNPTTRKQARVRAALLDSGLIEEVDGVLGATDTVFRNILAQQPAKEVATGVDRFMRDGKIDRYPASSAERRELLEWIVQQAIAEGEVLSEQEINDRLAAFTEDFAVLRRYLVDFELLERTASGSSYARASQQPAG
ncbi:MAG TPA: DUF2087 domain-containing protein [Glaciihabitans sp.]|jgi:hypothetical protein|nr:DUF2087 domain-containing protein [Glaciihabitans sp.]